MYCELPLLKGHQCALCCKDQTTNWHEVSPFPAGVGLKAAWYGAEVFGKLFGRADSGSSAEQAEASTSGRPALSWDELKAGIREDYDNNYFVSGCADMAVYDPQCEFADPFVSFKGVDRFKQNLANFGNLTCALPSIFAVGPLQGHLQQWFRTKLGSDRLKLRSELRTRAAARTSRWTC